MKTELNSNTLACRAADRKAVKHKGLKHSCAKYLKFTSYW